ncbi:glycine betaine/L-proline transporter ProP [Acetobacteraceae bacterium]|nr:glycine betaine/L-proline transporter ProP [Acetobacteraceae bacterium]
MRLRKKTVPLKLSDVTIIDDKKLHKAITAAALGNALEWFDFGVYGYLVTVLGAVFFPAASPSIQLIAALATFSVPFLIRPLGGMFFGVLGDKYGRQKILALTVILMTFSTFCIGLIPSYATIGVLAPIALLVCKMVQGFSVGGEYTGASIFIAEYSPDRRRGLMGSFLDFGSILGFVLGAGVVEILTGLVGQQGLMDWGWRLPFFLALPLGFVGIYLRNALEETPTFQQHVKGLDKVDRQALEEGPSVPLKNIAVKYWRSLLVAVGLVIVCNVTYYILLTYLPSYLEHNLGYSSSKGVLIIIVIMIGMLFVQPLVGFLSDKIGRRPFICAGSLGALCFAILAFKLIGSHVEAALFLGLFILAIILNCFIGVMASILPALFPTEVRYSALAISFNISVIVAGLTPTILAWLIQVTGNLMMPAYYLMGVGALGLVTAFFMKETANKPLRGASPAASDLEEAREILDEHHETLAQKIETLDGVISDLEKTLSESKKERQRFIDQHPHIN